jgi:hypothetical protein
MSSFLDTLHTLLGVKGERQSPPCASLLSLLQRLTCTMRLELPVLSFVSVALLILILPGQVRSFSIPSVSIIAWFFFCNLIHGINAILWSGNQSVHAPVWCDICEIFAHGSDCVLIVAYSVCCAPWCYGRPPRLFLVHFSPTGGDHLHSQN